MDEGRGLKLKNVTSLPEELAARIAAKVEIHLINGNRRAAHEVIDRDCEAHFSMTRFDDRTTEELLNTGIAETELDVRTIELLETHDAIFMRDLLNINARSIKEWRNVGGNVYAKIMSLREEWRMRIEAAEERERKASLEAKAVGQLKRKT